MFDTQNAESIFNDVNIRMAIEHAIDKVAIEEAFGYGFMAANNQMTPPQLAAWNADLPSRDYDVGKALELLEAAGYASGFTTKIITQGSSQPTALAIQEFLRAVNIETEVELVDNPKYWDYMREGWSDAMIVTDYAVNPSYPTFLRGMFPPTSNNQVSVKLPDEIVAKIEPALAEPDPVIAKQLSDELIRLIYEDASFIPTVSNAMGFIVAPYAHDTGFFEYYEWSIWTFVDTWIEK
jgi:peptide/nickel transport system substrate-binding protein